MTRNQADVLIVIVGLLVEAATAYGLAALGASERVGIMGALICMILTCLAVGDDGIYKVDRRSEGKH